LACGLIGTSYSCDPESAAANLAIVRRVLSHVQKGNISAEELAQAKNKIASRVVRYSERPSGRMRAIAGSWMYNAEYSDPDVELARYDAVSLASIREYLDAYPIDDLTVVGYGPVEKLD
jgi:predicted Zn-dependent peptidase